MQPRTREAIGQDYGFSPRDLRARCPESPVERLDTPGPSDLWNGSKWLTGRPLIPRTFPPFKRNQDGSHSKPPPAGTEAARPATLTERTESRSTRLPGPAAAPSFFKEPMR